MATPRKRVRASHAQQNCLQALSRNGAPRFLRATSNGRTYNCIAVNLVRLTRKVKVSHYSFSDARLNGLFAAMLHWHTLKKSNVVGCRIYSVVAAVNVDVFNVYSGYAEPIVATCGSHQRHDKIASDSDNL